MERSVLSLYSGKIIRGHSRFKELRSSILLGVDCWLQLYENTVAGLFRKSLWFNYAVVTNSLFSLLLFLTAITYCRCEMRKVSEE